MATPLEHGTQLKRLIDLYEVGTVEVTISHEGVVMRVPKTHTRLTCMWSELIDVIQLPDNAPRSFKGKPLEFLSHETDRVKKRQRRQ